MPRLDVFTKAMLISYPINIFVNVWSFAIVGRPERIRRPRKLINLLVSIEIAELHGN